MKTFIIVLLLAGVGFSIMVGLMLWQEHRQQAPLDRRKNKVP